MIKKIINYSTKYKQKGLKISLSGDRMVVTKGELIYDKIYKIDNDVSFKINDETVIIFLVEDLTTKEILIAASDGSIDKTKYRLIERLAWKTETDWECLSVKPFPEPHQAGGYNYGGLDKETIKKSLAVQTTIRKTIRPDGKIEAEISQPVNIKRKS